MNTMYMYRELNDNAAYGEEIIEIFPTRKQAEDYLELRFNLVFGCKPENFEKGEDDDIDPDYVSVQSGDNTLFFFVEEKEAHPLPNETPTNKVVFISKDGTETVLREGKNLDQNDVLFRSDYFATKLWSAEDIEMRMDDNGYRGYTDEDVAKVVNHGGKWSYLHDCTDGDWECIDEEIRGALGDPEDFNKSRGTWYAVAIEWDTDDWEANTEPVELPTEVEIPFTPNQPKLYSDDICDYLSDTYGFCVDGFELEFRKKTAA